MKDIKVFGVTVDSFFIIAAVACVVIGFLFPSRAGEAFGGAIGMVALGILDVLIQNVFWKEKK